MTASRLEELVRLGGGLKQFSPKLERNHFVIAAVNEELAARQFPHSVKPNPSPPVIFSCGTWNLILLIFIRIRKRGARSSTSAARSATDVKLDCMMSPAGFTLAANSTAGAPPSDSPNMIVTCLVSAFSGLPF